MKWDIFVLQKIGMLQYETRYAHGWFVRVSERVRVMHVWVCIDRRINTCARSISRMSVFLYFFRWDTWIVDQIKWYDVKTWTRQEMHEQNGNFHFGILLHEIIRTNSWPLSFLTIIRFTFLYLFSLSLLHICFSGVVVVVAVTVTVTVCNFVQSPNCQFN